MLLLDNIQTTRQSKRSTTTSSKGMLILLIIVGLFMMVLSYSDVIQAKRINVHEIREAKSGIKLAPLPDSNSMEDLKAFKEENYKLLKIWNQKRRLRNSKRGFYASDDFQIRHVHLAYTQQPNELVVQFHTFSYHDKLGKPLVRIGKSVNQLNTVYHVGAVTTGYGDTNHTGFDHAILMNNLEFDTTYHYQVGLGIVSPNGVSLFTVQSPVYNFTTRSEDPDEITLLSFADMGVVFSPLNVKRIQQKVRENAGNGNFFIWHAGDISYADFYFGFMYQFIWNLWFEYMEEIMPYVPYMVSVGNHEYQPRHPDVGQEYEFNFAAFNHKFWMPLRNDSSYGHNLWYHFDFGPVRFVSLDTETNFNHAPFPPVFKGDHVSYITNALKSTNKDQTPFVMVIGHRPIYSAVHDFSDARGNVIGQSKVYQKLWEELFRETTDLFMAGHVHAYERQYPVFNQTIYPMPDPQHLVSPNVTIHVINGSGGCLEGLEETQWYNKNIPWNYKMFNHDEGHAILKVKRNRQTRQVTADWKFHTATEQQVIDSFTLVKNY